VREGLRRRYSGLLTRSFPGSMTSRKTACAEPGCNGSGSAADRTVPQIRSSVLGGREGGETALPAAVRTAKLAAA